MFHDISLTSSLDSVKSLKVENDPLLSAGFDVTVEHPGIVSVGVSWMCSWVASVRRCGWRSRNFTDAENSMQNHATTMPMPRGILPLPFGIDQPGGSCGGYHRPRWNSQD